MRLSTVDAGFGRFFDAGAGAALAARSAALRPALDAFRVG